MTMKRNPDTTAAADFVAKLFDGSRIDLAAIHPENEPPRFKTFQHSQHSAIRDWLERFEGEWGLYYSPNLIAPAVQGKKARKDDIVGVRAVYVDIDELSDDVLTRLRNYQIPPSVIIMSGGGYQALWILKEASEELYRAEQINAALAQELGGDHVHNVDRLLRLPYLTNVPNRKKRLNGRVPVVSELVEFDLDRRYSLDDFPPDNYGPGPAGPKGAPSTAPLSPVELAQLPSLVSEATRKLILLGDELDDEGKSRFASRSEAVYSVACQIARCGGSEEVIAGVLMNPGYGISASVLEKRNARAYALRQARRAKSAVESGWPETTAKGRPVASLANALVGLGRLGHVFRYDQFRHRKIVDGAVLREVDGEVSDDIVSIIRGQFLDEFNFDPRADNIRDAINQLALENAFHPVREMLASLQWDGLERISRWLTTYLGAQDTPLNREIGRIILVAAVRRVMQPGVKFDTILVLEGIQGSGKSTALQILAGNGLHSDQEILTQEPRAQMELLEGVWIYELGEVEGLNKAEVNKIKAFASRREDRSRMAYGRYVEARSRQAVFIGTTNETSYLRDQTGNRRFWPIKTGIIDLRALAHDRDQLWAEAVLAEAAGEQITLPEQLWEAAAVEQAERLEEDPWLEKLASLRGKAYGDLVRLETHEILTSTLGIPVERQNQSHSKRLATLMRKLGWEHAKFRVSQPLAGDASAGRVVRGYERPKLVGHVDDVRF
ncbi:VapE domain-containing protein [Sinorhizobium medicae]